MGVSVVLGGSIASMYSATHKTEPVQNTETVGENAEEVTGAAVPQSPALVDTYLTAGISSSETSMTLADGTTRGGTSLSGFMCFTIDVNTPTIEYVCGTASGTSITGLTRGVDVLNPNTTSTALAFSHRRFASVQISDYPTLQILVRKMNGTDTLDNFLSYTTSTAIPTTDGQLANKYYVDQVGAGGFTCGNVSTTLGVLCDGSVPDKVGVNVSTTNGGLSFDSDGRLKILYGANSGVGTNSNGLFVERGDNYTWTGLHIFSGHRFATTSATSSIPWTSANTSTLHGSWVGTSTPGAVFYVGSDGYSKGLTIGSYGQALMVSTTTGFPEWTGVGSRLAFVTSTIIDNTDLETTIVTTTIPAGAMGTNGYVTYKLFISNFQNTDSTVILRLKIGATTVSTVTLPAAAVNLAQGTIEGILSNANSQSSQVGIISADFGLTGTSPVSYYGVARGTSAVNMSSAQDMAITIDFSNDTNVSSTIAGGYVELFTR